jgi:hypothetical protein
LQETIPYSFFSKNLSRERLSRYLIASNGDEKVAIGFYEKTFLKYSGRPIKIFSKLREGINRKTIKIKLTAVRHLRNRISHNEPICFEGQRFSLKNAERIFEETITIFEWIDPIFAIWLKKFIKSAHLFY